MKKIQKNYSLLPLALVVLDALIKEDLVHLHKELLGIVDESVNGLVPVRLCVSVQGRKHNGQNGCD